MAFYPPFVALENFCCFLLVGSPIGSRPFFVLSTYWQSVRGTQAAPPPWPGDGPQAVLWVRGRHDAANGIMFDRSYRADPERPNVVSSDGLAL